jgi:hypothetical protein
VAKRECLLCVEANLPQREALHLMTVEDVQKSRPTELIEGAEVLLELKIFDQGDDMGEGQIVARMKLGKVLKRLR